MGFFLGILMTLFVLLLFSLNPEFLHNLELKMLDQRFKWRGPRDPGDRVVIVAIDDKSIQSLGQWPWPRSVLAELIERLGEAKAKVIGFDIVFAELDTSSLRKQMPERQEDWPTGMEFSTQMLPSGKEMDTDVRLAKAIQRAGNVVLGMAFYFTEKEVEHLSALQRQHQEPQIRGAEISIVRGSSEHSFALLPTARGVLANIPLLTKAAYATGHFNQYPDADGTIRRLPLVIKFQDSLYPSLDLQILRAYLHGAPIQVEAKDFGIARFRVGTLHIPTSESGKLLIDYAGPAFTFPTYSFVDVLKGKVASELFHDKIVLVGPIALGIYDIRVTPFSTVFPGVEIHANVVDNILSERFIVRGQWILLIDALSILMLGLGLGYILLHLSPLSGALITLGGFLGYIGVNYLLFAKGRMWLHLLYPLTSMALTYTTITVYKYFTEEKEKRFIKGAFSQYLAPTVINQLLADPSKLQLGGERRVCTAFFSDVVGFSTISEQLKPEALVALLNEYLSEMTEILLQYEGTVDKYEGDAIVAFFGAPISYADHARRACFASLDMQQQLAEMRRQWEKEGKPLLRMRIGLNTGPMVIGNMGSRLRMNYTMMGDAVNLAARLEGANKEYGTSIMISDATYAVAKESIEVRELDTIRVVGKITPTVVYELLARKGTLSSPKVEVLQWYQAGLEAYKTRQWEKAIQYFLEALRLDPKDGPSHLYLKRCEAYKTSPPPEHWDGVYVLTIK